MGCADNLEIELAAGQALRARDARRWSDRIAALEADLDAERQAHAATRAALMEVRAKARFELDYPTGLHATCLSLIFKAADAALADAALAAPAQGKGGG